MGWTHTPIKKLREVKSEIIGLLQSSNGRKVIASCFRGNPRFAGVLWSVVEWETEAGVKRLITCDILEYWNTAGMSGWAYKSICETMGPYRFTCPKSYLKMTEGEIGFSSDSFSAEWRKSVIEYHAEKKRKKRGY